MLNEASMRLDADWVIVGAEIEDPKRPEIAVMIVASTHLTRSELLAVFDQFDVNEWPVRRRREPKVGYKLTAEMDRVVIMFGSTYGEAIADLFKEWSPSRKPAPLPDGNHLRLIPGIDGGDLALDDGDCQK